MAIDYRYFKGALLGAVLGALGAITVQNYFPSRPDEVHLQDKKIEVVYKHDLYIFKDKGDGKIFEGPDAVVKSWRNEEISRRNDYLGVKQEDKAKPKDCAKIDSTFNHRLECLEEKVEKINSRLEGFPNQSKPAAEQQSYQNTNSQGYSALPNVPNEPAPAAIQPPACNPPAKIQNPSRSMPLPKRSTGYTIPNTASAGELVPIERN